jgi:peptidoglycan/xylan/chitin deacetylase (PgdA/CDA1 family)
MPRRLPILLFHDLAHDAAPIAFPPAGFAAMLDAVQRAGWRAATLQDGLGWLAGGSEPEQRVVITFDDGYRSVYEAAYPLLCEGGLSATVFVATGRGHHTTSRLEGMYGRERLSWAEMREMQAGGIAFGAHTCSHRNLTCLPDPAIQAEMRASQAALQDALGIPVRSFAYPYGMLDARVLAAAREWFDAAVSTRLAAAAPTCDRHALPRIEMAYFRHPRLRRLLTSRSLPAYLWLRRGPRAVRQSLIRQGED